MKKKRPLIKRIFDLKMALYDFVKWTGALPALIDLRMKRIYFSGKKPKKFFRGSYIVASNHISFSDPVILSTAFWKRRVGFVATSTLFENKFWDKVFRGFGCIPIDKDNVSLKTFKAVEDRIYRGHVVAVFPEGGVEREGEINPFKDGVVMMALISGADIVPMFIARRKKRYRRQVVVIGDKICIKDHIDSEFPSMNEIQRVASLIKEKELELEKRYNEYAAKKYKK